MKKKSKKTGYLLFIIPFTFLISSCSANLLAIKETPKTEPNKIQIDKDTKNLVKGEIDNSSSLSNDHQQQTPDIQHYTAIIVVEPPPASDVANLNAPANEEEYTETEKTIAEEEAEITYDVPIVVNNSVEAHLEYFKTRGRERFELWLSRSGRYIPMMKEILREKELPEDLVYLALIESGFNPYAYSRARASGPWQFMKSTGKRYGLKIDWWIDERRDPKKSTIAAANYLTDLYNMFGSWDLAMASYNGGEGRVQRAMARTKTDDFWQLKKTRHLHKETRNYVPKYMAATIIAKNPVEYDFDINYLEPIQYDEVQIEESTDLRVIARCAGVTYEEIKELNPELRKWVTPPNVNRYILKIPTGTKEIFLENYSKIPSDEKVIWERHLVKKGETISFIARKYRVTVDDLKRINLLKNGVIRKGDHLLIPHAPEGTKASIRLASTPLTEGKHTVYHRIKKGDTLWKIAKNYNVSIASIKEWNRLKSAKDLRAGKSLKLIVNADDL